MIIFLIILVVFFRANAGLLIKPEDALKETFPEGEIIKKNILLTQKEAKDIQSISKIRLKSKIVTVYLVKKDDKITAYGILDTHRVRTKNEAILFVLDPQCNIQDVEIIAFYEPPEYIPSEKWLSLFEGKSDRKDIKNIPNITGATLSARAVKKSSIKAMAICKVVLEKKKK
ncbi:FMN-binding protein [Persephonella sp.]